MRSVLALAALLAVFGASLMPVAGLAVETGSLAKTPTLAAPAPVAAKSPVAEAAPQPAVPPHPAAMAVRQRLADKLLDATAEERQGISTFYDARAGEPLFADAGGLTARANAVFAELKQADDWGLPSSQLVPTKLPVDAKPLTAADIVGVEVRMSLAVSKYANYARGGRIPDPAKQLASYLDRKPRLVDTAVVLKTLAEAPAPDAALRGFNPQHPAFEALRKAYLEARKFKTSPDDEDPLADTPSLRPGIHHPAVETVRQLLKLPAAEVDGKPGDPEVFDPALVEAIVAFQEANGLTPPDGIIGPRTRAAIASLKPPGARALLANMEQWRWMPADLGATRIEVNLPEFKVRMFDNGQVIHTERIVSGKVDTQTPIFSESMKTVVLMPDWVLPESIKVNEAIPSLLGHGGMFWSSGLKIKRGQTGIDPGSVNWNSANTKAYTFYQPPGDSNALGQVKFLFPNKHAVYMHDTPSKHLFEQAERAFSHGCMRVRDPVKLAQLILLHDKGWPAEKVQALIDDGPEDNKIALDQAIPVHVTYFTAVADETGKVHSFKDIYGHQERISLALEGRWGDIDIPEDHLAPVEDREFEYKAASAERRSNRGNDNDDRPAKNTSNGGGAEFEKALKNLFGGF